MRGVANLTMLFFIGVLISCGNSSEEVSNKVDKESIEEQVEVSELSKAEIIVNEAIDAHGGVLYDGAYYSFVFREKKYSFQNKGIDYIYTVKSVKEETETYTVLNNGLLTQTVNGEKVTLSEKEIAKYSGALNSVVYFATLPHKLKDKAVNKKWIEATTIKGKEYDVVEVTFSTEGGGEDHDDEFHYWMNKETKIIDYFAYNYRVNDGGVRFRSAYNSRVIDGIVFQDYINYKAEVGTLLKDLSILFEQGKLKELSKIETEQVTNLKK